MDKSSLIAFRIVAFLEGLSFLLLLFWAMPMKYMFDEPIYVRVIGMAHGLLFMLYIFLLSYQFKPMRSKYGTTAILLMYLASVLPFGTFYTEYRYLRK